jgi:HEAT repeat protein
MQRTLFNTLGCLTLLASAAMADPWADVLTYKIGQPRTALTTIEDQVRATQAAALPALEDRLLGALKSPRATMDCRDWACRQLRQVGSEKSVPVLAALLADKQLSTVARLALQSIPGPAADAALRGALPKLTGAEKVGVVQTLGVRRDRQAVPLVAPLAADADPVVAEMALFALGQIGTPEAFEALRVANIPGSLNRARYHALLRCAEQLPAQAAEIYGSVLTQSKDTVIQMAALRGLVLADPAKAAPAVLAAAHSPDKKLRLLAVQLACQPGRSKLLAQLLPRAGALPVDARVTLLTLVGDPAALSAVLAATGAAEESVRVAAIGALGRLAQDGPSLGKLIDLAASEKGPAQDAARAALRTLRMKQADETLMFVAENAAVGGAWKSPSGAVKAEAIRSLAARNAIKAVPTLLGIAAGPDRTLHGPAFEALGTLADRAHLPALLKLLATASEAADRDAAQTAVAAVGRRASNQEAVASCVVAAMAGASPEARSTLLGILAGISSPKSLAAFRAALSDADPNVKAAAVRGLAGWSDPEVIGDLLAIARTADRPTHKVLALRGIARLAATDGKPSAATAKILVECLGLASRAEEKRLVLGAMGELADRAALDAALGCMADPAIESEAATAAVRIAKNLRTTHPQPARVGLEQVIRAGRAPAARKLAENALLLFDLSANIAPQGVASSPDDLDKDGASGGDQAAIDNNPATYWDEVDGKPLYRLVVTFQRPERISAVSLTGYAQHSFAAKTFDILGDDKPVKHVDNARYDDNFLVVRFPAVTCTRLELRITGYYGRSPAIRELGIYRSAEVK